MYSIMVYRDSLRPEVQQEFETLLHEGFFPDKTTFVLDGVTKFGVYVGTTLIAVACVRERRLTFSKVCNVAVRHGFRRVGVCSFLMDYLKAVYPRLYLCVDNDNEAAIRCYQKAGFQMLPGYGGERVMKYGSFPCSPL